MFEAELVGFRGLSLILQHRALAERLDAIERAISSCQSVEMTDCETAAQLVPLLRGFAQALPSHFAAESRSKGPLLYDGSDPALGRALEQLDSEHPHLLATFEAAVEQLTRCAESKEASHVAFEQAMAELLTAMGEFRSHEAREDALFAD